jgi:hypothetical protein
MDPIDRAAAIAYMLFDVDFIVGMVFAVTGGVLIIMAMPDYGTGLLLMFGVWFAIIGHRILARKKG